MFENLYTRVVRSGHLVAYCGYPDEGVLSARAEPVSGAKARLTDPYFCGYDGTARKKHTRQRTPAQKGKLTNTRFPLLSLNRWIQSLGE